MKSLTRYILFIYCFALLSCNRAPEEVRKSNTIEYCPEGEIPKKRIIGEWALVRIALIQCDSTETGYPVVGKETLLDYNDSSSTYFFEKNGEITHSNEVLGQWKSSCNRLCFSKFNSNLSTPLPIKGQYLIDNLTNTHIRLRKLYKSYDGFELRVIYVLARVSE
jgi:hypothetical protein